MMEIVQMCDFLDIKKHRENTNDHWFMDVDHICDLRP